ncbi:MAG: helix-turn-helix transcriptional regulator [Amylibacter sp.]|jgi:DNA-binding CsgD family transcriptional regulator|nr:helix-turn-helix transcriptional regulator [Amylibacter sp.]
MDAEDPEILLARAIKSLNDDRFARDLNAWLRGLAHQDNTTILAYFRNQTPRLLMTDSETPDVHRNMEPVYLRGAYLLDPFYEVHRSGAAAGLYRIWDIAPDQFNRNQYFNEYYRRTTLIDEIAFVVWPSPEISVHVCLGRDARSGQKFSRRERATAKQVFPIVQSLACVNWAKLRFSSADRKENVVDRMIRLVAETNHINLTNRQAEVALLVLQGHSSTSIGLRLGISPQTVKVFRKQLYKRCEVSSQAELFGLMLPILSSQNEPFGL